MRLRWLSLAIGDLVALRAYIARDNPVAASDVARRIRQTVELLRDQAGMGRPGRVEGTKELVISGTPYIVPYRVRNEEVQVLRVLHGAQRWPKEFPQ